MTAEGTDLPPASDDEEQAVLRYLQALEAGRAAPDDFPDPDAAAPALAGADMVAADDQDALEVVLAESVPGSKANVRSLEDDFVRVAADYARRQGTSYESWRQAGVAPEVLARAGIPVPGE